MREGIGPTGATGLPKPTSIVSSAPRSNSVRFPASVAPIRRGPEQKEEEEEKGGEDAPKQEGGVAQAIASVECIRERCLSQLSTVYDQI